MTDEDKLFICRNCVKDIRYKLLIEKIETMGVCSGCRTSDYVIDVDNTEFVQMTKALIRYHFSEWDYNTHFGGDGYGRLFYDDENIFLNKTNFSEAEVYDELVNRIECFEVYEDYHKGVSLFAGYFEGRQNPLLRSIRADMDYSIEEVAERLKDENYFTFEDQITEILTPYVTGCTLTVKKGESFYRSRVGFSGQKKSLFFGGFEGEVLFVPYSNSQIGAPPPYLAGLGRLNRAGVSYLYCASDKYTALSEIRPHPGDIVSVGKFIINRDVALFDLTEAQFLNFYSSDANLDKFKRLNTFSEYMQKVIPPSERQAYSMTQLIADCIRKLNFDGILFPSSVGKGKNIVLFNPRNMDYTFDDAEVVEVQAVKYEYCQRNWKKHISEID